MSYWNICMNVIQGMDTLGSPGDMGNVTQIRQLFVKFTVIYSLSF